MDEIERILKENRLTTDFDTQRILGDYAFSKSDLKKLIELVENEQVNDCTNQHILGRHTTGDLEWDEQAVNATQNAPRVSEQIDWEEL